MKMRAGTETDDNTSPMRAVVFVAYCHVPSKGAANHVGLLKEMLLHLVDEEFDATEVQLAQVEVLHIEPDEAVVYHVEDHDDLDEWDDVDDLRVVTLPGSTPR